MTVKELINELEKLPQDSKVWVREEYWKAFSALIRVDKVDISTGNIILR